MFIFKGISTKDMKIIVEEPENLIAKAPLKHEVLNIEGRDDTIYHPLGYAPVEIPLTLQLLDRSKIDQVLMWLNGEGELIYKNRKTKARIFSEIQPIRTAGIRIINIEIIRAPFWYDLEDDYSEAWGANLIPNGWDSFEPYGSGKNYVENWNFESDDLSEFRGGNALDLRIKDNVLIGEVGDGGVLQASSIILLNNDLPKDKYMVRFSIRSNTEDISVLYRPRINNPDRIQRGYDLVPNEKNIIEFEFDRTVDTEYDIYIYARRNMIAVEVGDRLELDWIQLTPVDNQHLIVEKTPLENGLTRIQTWGGNARRKLWIPKALPINKTYTSALLIKNKGKAFEIRPFNSTLHFNHNISELFDGFDVSTGEITMSEGQMLIIANNPADNLDFIASDPIIVEGDTSPTWEADENPRIVNEGTAPSKPLIKLTKGTSSTCEFEVNGVYFKYHFNNDDHVIIDCEEMEARYNGLPRNRHLTIGFEFPTLKVGDNVVKNISGDAKIEFKRKDRWL